MAVSGILDRDFDKTFLKFTGILSKNGLIVKNLWILFMIKNRVITISHIGLQWLPCPAVLNKNQLLVPNPNNELLLGFVVSM